MTIPRVSEDMEKLNHPSIAGRNRKWYCHSGNSLIVSQKTKHAATIWLKNRTPRHLSQRNKNICSQRSIYISVHSSSFINNRQKLETTLTFFGRWKVKQTVVHPYRGILQAIKRYIHNNLDGEKNPKRLHSVWFHLYNLTWVVIRSERQGAKGVLGYKGLAQVPFFFFFSKSFFLFYEIALYLDCGSSRMNLHMW